MTDIADGQVGLQRLGSGQLGFTLLESLYYISPVR